MCNNSTCYLDSIVRKHSDVFYAVTLSTSVITAILYPVAVVGNALITAAIWKNYSLRTPAYILLFGLAFTDFCTGLITQPVYIAGELIPLTNPQAVKEQKSLLNSLRAVVELFATYFASLTLILVTLMSIERWLHMTRRSLLTVRRSCIIVTILYFLLIPFVLFRLFYVLKGKRTSVTDTIVFIFILICITTTSIAYFKVYRVIRHHQQQIQSREPSQNFGQPAIDVAKYKKSVFTVLYILAVFYISYVPTVISFGLSIASWHHHSARMLAVKITMMFLLISSSINPLIYLWRMNDIRNAVKHLLKQLLCKEN